MFKFLEEYAKHAALNLGQGLQGIRYFYSHPKIDALAPRGSIQHIMKSVRLRSKLVANDLFFASIPPHWHHSADELKDMTKTQIHLWFQYGYCAWRFEESGQTKADLSTADRRWDPGCDDK